MGAFSPQVVREKYTMTRFFWAVACLLASTTLLQTEGSLTPDKMAKMSKAELISELKTTQQRVSIQDHKISSLHKQLNNLQYGDQLTAAQEKQRRAHEKANKAKAKALSLKKKQAKMNKKMKLSDILMEHGAKYLAFAAAKKHKSEGSTDQEKKVLEAAKKGGRAGAAGPLRKVVHNAAVTAVKAARNAAKKAGKHYNKHKMRKVSMAAAKAAVNKIFKEQDDLVEKVAKKWTDKAIAKYPPAILLAKHHNTPNKFTAPPTIHLVDVDQVVPEK